MNDSDGSAVALRSFLVAGLRLLEVEAEKSPIPVVPEERFEFGDNSFGTVAMPVRLYRVFVRHRKELIQRLPEASVAREALLREETLYSRAFLHNTDRKLASQEVVGATTELLNIFLGSYLEHYESFQMTDSHFEEHLTRFRSIWQSEQITHIVTVPLLGFHSETGFDLDQNVSVVHLDPKLKSELWRPSVVGLPAATSWDFAMAQFAVVGRYTTDSPVRGDFAYIMPKIERAILAMRLLKAGAVYAEVAFDTLEYPYLAPARTTIPQDHLRAKHIHQDYSLNRSEITEVRLLYSMLSQPLMAKTLDVATSRFQQTYTRDRPEDRVIDLTIALESMLLPESGGELALRLNLRGAALLSSTYPANRSFSLLQEMYRARSKIVHGGAKLIELSSKKGLVAELGVDKFVEEAAEWVRAGIRRYLHRVSSGESLKSIAAALDDQIIRGIGQSPGEMRAAARA